MMPPQPDARPRNIRSGGAFVGPKLAQLSAGASRISPRLFSEIRALAYQIAGIDLQEGKEEMVSGRLSKRARANGFSGTEAYFEAVQSDSSGELRSDFIDALTTNHTSFFREPAHFEFLKESILPHLRQRDQFTIWTAAAATGEEPHSIAVTLAEELGLLPGGASASGGSARYSSARPSVRASDISTRALAIAKRGVYPEERFRGLPADFLRRYTLRGRGQQEGNYCFRPEIRNLIRFEQINLMEPLPAEGPFPVIFLRNIMIYFDRPTQEKVVAALTAKLEPGGYLFVGHSESLNGIRHELEHVQVAIYRKPGPAIASATGSERKRKD
jgi:chemotaxis protein methyltransferase CheR